MGHKKRKRTEAKSAVSRDVKKRHAQGLSTSALATAHDSSSNRELKPFVFRVSGIRAEDTARAEEITRTAIQTQLTLDEKKHFVSDNLRVSIAPSCYNNSFIALVDATPLPGFLSALRNGPLESREKVIRDLTFDSHFLGFTQLYSTISNPVADVIFVTGLGGHAYGSWASKNEPWHMWPRHFLAGELTGCRTMTYGYNTQLSVAGFESLLDFTRGFLGAVRLIRKTDRDRPILFIAHSFGGILLASALVKDSQAGGEVILRATKCIIFFAVPHRGLDVADMLAMANDYDGQSREELLGQIQQNSNWLRSQLDGFVDIVGDRKVVSFYETHQTRRLKQGPDGSWARTGPFATALSTESAVLSLPSQLEDKYPVAADHSAIVKFTSKSSQIFMQVLTYLQDFESDALQVKLPPVSPDGTRPGVNTAPNDRPRQLLKAGNVHEGTHKEFDALADKCRQLLHMSDYVKHKDRNPDRVEGTCQWFLNHEEFNKWLKGNSDSGLLWVSADPGCGKSVLSKFLVDKKLNQDLTVCYFFFKADNEDQRTATQALCAILHQLFVKFPSLTRHAVPDYRHNGDKLVGLFDRLWDILIRVANDKESGDVVCILDGLDECDAHERSFLLKSLRTHFGDSSGVTDAKAGIKFLITSRPYFELIVMFGEVTHIHLAGENDKERDEISKEIDIVIDYRVEELVRQRKQLGFTPELGDFLKSRLHEQQNRTYLWLYLIFEELKINMRNTRKGLETVIQKLPKSVDEVYEAILSRTIDRQQAVIILQIIVAAKRPLTIAEMQLAIEIYPECTSEEDIDMEPEDGFKTRIRNICGLFVIVQDNTVALIHQTAREFLLTPEAGGMTALDTWKHSISNVQANSVLAWRCIYYLLFDEYKLNPLKLRRTLFEPIAEDKASIARYLKKHHTFLEYAAVHWRSHYQEGSLSTTAPEPKYLQLCNTRLTYCRTWFPINWYATRKYEDRPSLRSMLVLAALMEHESLAKHALKYEHAENTPQKISLALLWAAHLDHRFVMQIIVDECVHFRTKVEAGSALIEAAFRDHPNTVSILLKGRENLDIKAYTIGKALIQAASEGHDDVVKTIIAHATDATPLNGPGGRALVEAILGDKESTAMILLNNKLDQSSIEDSDNAALFHSLHNKQPTIAKLLIERGANSSNPDVIGSILAVAASSGLQEIVQMMLDRDADPNTVYEGSTPLIQAAAQGHDTIVELLCKRGANLNAVSKEKQTALMSATLSKHENTVVLLLEHGADPNLATEDGFTVLHHASRKGCEKLVSLLIERGVDVQAKAKTGSTPITEAAEDFHEPVVRLLADHGGNVNETGSRGKTLLWHAAEAGYESLIALLLSKGANVHLRTDDERTPLWVASWRNRIEAVKLLIDGGSEIDSRDSMKRTPLWVAAAWGNAEIVDLLVAAGADVNAVGSDGLTILRVASQHGHDAIVKSLLSKTPDLEARGKDGATALFAAVRYGRLEIVKMLIGAGADVNAKDGENRTMREVAEYGSCASAIRITEEDSKKLLESLVEKRPELKASENSTAGDDAGEVEVVDRSQHD